MSTQCDVCMHKCLLAEGQVGRCRTRQNVGGKIISINYGCLTSIALDPIEKKPLNRFYPGAQILSVGSFGCNLHCPFCQNWQISMQGATTASYRQLTPQKLVELAKELVPRGNIGIAYTYNEPLISWEYVLECSKLVHAAGLKNVAVTNGSILPAIAQKLLPHLDALNIDLKGIRPEAYRTLGGDLATVQEFIRLAAKQCHVELTNLVVTNFNDSKEEMEELSQYVASIDPNIPLHITRFFPRYHMVDREATPVARLKALAQIARKYVRYVYLGNC